MFHTPAYQGNDITVFQTHSGKSIELSQEEMQSLFEILRSMPSIDGSTPDEIGELENRISDLRDENDRLENELKNEVNKHDFNDDIKAELKRKLEEIVEELS